jgi:hypothetical protein
MLGIAGLDPYTVYFNARGKFKINNTGEYTIGALITRRDDKNNHSRDYDFPADKAGLKPGMKSSK